MSGGRVWKENIKREIYSWGKTILFAFIIAFICRQFLFAPTIVRGESMDPTFEDENMSNLK